MTIGRMLVFTLLLGSWMLGGCSYSAPVTFERAASARGVFTIARLNQRLAGKSVLLRMLDSSKTRGRFISCSAQTCWILREEGDSSAAPQIIAIPLEGIGSIEYRDHAMGALIGFLAGAGSGYMISSGSWISSRYDPRNEKLVGGPEFLVGGLTGCLVGGLAGQSCVYRLPAPSD